jgi:hypothetical protein
MLLLNNFHYYSSWFLKMSKLINKSFLINGQVHFNYGLGAWMTRVILTSKFDLNDLYNYT